MRSHYRNRISEKVAEARKKNAERFINILLAQFERAKYRALSALAKQIAEKRKQCEEE